MCWWPRRLRRRIPTMKRASRAWSAKYIMSGVGRRRRPAPTASSCCAASTATGVRHAHVFLKGLNSPFGMALVGDTLYVADTDAVLAFPYHDRRDPDHRAGRQGRRPAGRHDQSPLDQEHRRQPRRHASSTSPSAPTAMSARTAWRRKRAARESGKSIRNRRASAIFASGIRNRNGMGWEPGTDALWTAVERARRDRQRSRAGLHDLGEGRRLLRLALQLLRAARRCAGQPPRPDLVAKAIAPDYALGAHTASLGLAFYRGGLAPRVFGNGAFIGQHGSWNRNPRERLQSDLRAVRRRPAGRAAPSDVLTGFLVAEGEAQGRPVGVVMDRQGALLVADDVGNRSGG